MTGGSARPSVPPFQAFSVALARFTHGLISTQMLDHNKQVGSRKSFDEGRSRPSYNHLNLHHITILCLIISNHPFFIPSSFVTGPPPASVGHLAGFGGSVAAQRSSADVERVGASAAASAAAFVGRRRHFRFAAAFSFDAASARRLKFWCHPARPDDDGRRDDVTRRCRRHGRQFTIGEYGAQIVGRSEHGARRQTD